ncbi:DUF6882 domain-containing protein [Planobispora takensis]|uniref:Uncharacterized protein n=1 Tax=Planobispora takensis TaxID=1367882 RepID=A0A8J3WZZ9_9ACTN|nr:DUF6882 domain-containing protein [Planobispora takensis]GII05257.1 hypothetical protein Pta02_72650 [Planobispora takensis]
MPETITLLDLLDDAAILSLEHQLHLMDLVGDHSWNVDMHQQRFDFIGPRATTCTGFQLLGTAAPGPRSWLWAWANPSGFPESLVAASAALRDFGERHGIAELASAEVPFDALPGSPTEPATVVGFFIDAAKAVTGRWTSYNGDAGGGTRAAFLIEHPDFQLPPPNPPRTMRVIAQALTDMWVTDHRRALHSYGLRRQLNPVFSPDFAKLTLSGPGLEATVEFDRYDRVADIDASMSPH